MKKYLVTTAPVKTITIYVSDNGAWCEARSLRAGVYAMGQKEPNYPLPAIRYSVEYAVDVGWIRIWNDTQWTRPMVIVG